MISSVIPSLKYSASAVGLMFRNGRTAIDSSLLDERIADSFGFGVRRVTSCGPDAVVRAASRNAKARSRAERNRSSRFFSRQCCRISSTSAGSLPLSLCGFALSRRTATIVSAVVGRRNAGRPVSISNSTAPNAKMSER